MRSNKNMTIRMCSGESVVVLRYLFKTNKKNDIHELVICFKLKIRIQKVYIFVAYQLKCLRD